MRILYTNLADTAYIERVSGTDALPASNLGNKERENVWRSSLGDTTATIAVRLDGQNGTGLKALNMVSLYRANLSNAATWQVRVWDDAAMTTLIYDSGSMDAVAVTALGDLDWGVDPLGKTLYTGWGHIVSTLWLPNTVYGNYLRIDLADTPSDGYMQASRLFVGQYWEPEHAPKRGMQAQWVDTSKPQRTEGGTVHVEPGVQYRRIAVAGDKMIEADRIHIVNVLRNKGLREDMFLSVFPDLQSAYERDHQMQCVLAGMGAMTLPLYGLVDMGFVFEEI